MINKTFLISSYSFDTQPPPDGSAKSNNLLIDLLTVVCDHIPSPILIIMFHFVCILMVDGLLLH